MKSVEVVLAVLNWFIKRLDRVSKDQREGDLARAIRDGNTEEIARQWRNRQKNG